jgi:hypothetical protein
MRAWIDVTAPLLFAAVLLLPQAAAVAQARRPPALPPGIAISQRAQAPLPDTDFVWTWGEPSGQDDEGSADQPRDEGLVVVRVEGRQGVHACELTAELLDFFDPKSDRVKAMRRALEGLDDDQYFASRVRTLMETQGRDSVLRSGRLSCVVSPSEEELRARERARNAQERRRSQ